MKKSLISCIALLLLLGLTLTSCNSDTNVDTGTQAPGTSEEQTTEDTNDDFIEEDTEDYGDADALPESNGLLDLPEVQKVTDNEYKLTADITLSETCTVEFVGTLDGNGKKITTSVPVFEKLNGATVKNLTIEGTVDYSTETKAVGALAISANNTTLEGVTNKAAVSGYSASGGTLVLTAGGLVGVSTGDFVATNCANEGAVDCGAEAGGILGIAESGTLTLTGCTNTGAITSHFTGAGGIVGRSGDKELGGTVAVIDGCTNSGAIVGVSHVGGIFGGLEGAKYNKTIKNCLNTADINGVRNVGGIGGKIVTANNETAYRRNVVILEKCGNSGNITALSTEKGIGTYDYGCFAGGLVGYLQVGGNGLVKTTLCYNVGDIDAKRTYSDEKTEEGVDNYAAGLFNGYQMRIKADVDPAQAEFVIVKNYDTSYFSGNYVSGKITAHKNEDGSKTALLFTDIAYGKWDWTKYNLEKFFGSNFFDVTVTGEHALVSPTTDSRNTYDALTYAKIDASAKIAEGKLNDAQTVELINSKIKLDTNLGISTNVYQVGNSGYPVYVK